MDVDADVDADTVERASASDGTDVFRARPGGAPEKERLGFRSERMGAAGQARVGPQTMRRAAPETRAG
jgi:hypothetical protein